MPILRLAYTTQFLLALIAIFILWSEVGGQSHLDLLPWYWKFGLGAGAAFTTVKATAAAVDGKRPWNSRTLKWFGLTLLLLLGCGLASFYAHVYLEDDDTDPDQGNSTISQAMVHSQAALLIAGPLQGGQGACGRKPREPSPRPPLFRVSAIRCSGG